MNEETRIIRLLFVEDDEDDYILTSELLQRSELLRFAIDWAPSAEEARAILRENRHDICLMDYRLGTEVGVTLVRDAIRLGFTAPIIMLTGQDDTGVEIEAAKAGAVDFLVKDNLTLEQLQRSIRYALARSEIQAERFERLRAESANRSKSEFLANLSHEIRTPLTAILGYTELLIDQYQDRDQELTARLSIIDRNGVHLLSLLNDTLDLSKIEAGKLEIEMGAVELGPFLSDIVSLTGVTAQEKGLDFKLQCLSALPAQIRTDSMRLRQILLNLLGNAVKFTEQGEVELGVELRKADTGYKLLFKVRDTGQGIQPDYLDNIFHPFTQVPTETRMLEGTGLGLTISLKLAEKLGGTIEVESTPGRGSLFTLSIDPGKLPHESIGPLDLSTNLSSSSIQPLENLCGKVLIVDDVEDIRNLIHSILVKAGVETGFAANGREALEMLERGSGVPEYALVLMDLNMPLMDGFQTIQEMHWRGIDVPAIALTAASLQGEREKCLARGFCGYISKPIAAPDLISAISEALKDRRAGEESAPPPRPSAGRKRILVVEDNVDANKAVCMLLEHLNNEVQAALSAGEALERFSRFLPDIVLADINLPDADGFSLAASIHERYPGAKIILLSGEEPGRHLPPYIAGRIVKPVTLSILKELTKD